MAFNEFLKNKKKEDKKEQERLDEIINEILDLVDKKNVSLEEMSTIFAKLNYSNHQILLDEIEKLKEINKEK